MAKGSLESFSDITVWTGDRNSPSPTPSSHKSPSPAFAPAPAARPDVQTAWEFHNTLKSSYYNNYKRDAYKGLSSLGTFTKMDQERRRTVTIGYADRTVQKRLEEFKKKNPDRARVFKTRADLRAAANRDAESEARQEDTYKAKVEAFGPWYPVNLGGVPFPRKFNEDLEKEREEYNANFRR